MPQLPAVCTNCGRTFPSGFGYSGGATNLFASASLAGPCPYCGGMGRVDVGLDNAGSVHFLRSAADFMQPLTKEELQQLRLVLEHFQANPDTVTKEQIVEEVAKQSPALSRLADLIRAQTTTNVLQLVQVILALISVLLVLHSGQSVSDHELNNIVATATIQPLPTPTATPTPPPTPIRSPQKNQQVGIGRNDPCWCGSGKKYKHCHMNIDRT